MDIKLINSFLHKHTSAKYFDADVKLFLEKLPDNKIIRDIKNLSERQKASLDERICAELLQLKNACIDCIWENRGFYINAKGIVKPLNEKTDESSELTDLENQLIEFDLTVDKPDYNRMKQFVYDFKVTLKDNKLKTYVAALLPIQEQALQKANFLAEKKRLVDAELTETLNTSNDVIKIADTVGTDATEKKSEGQEPNTQI